MALPQPVDFDLTSSKDASPITCRLYLPNPSSSDSIVPRVAVVAHPLARLGGSQDDAVVVRVASSLVKHGFVVGTFNFRTSSWNLQPEILDYSNLVAFLLHYVKIPQPAATGPASILLAGYSFGSFVASRVNFEKHVVDGFTDLEHKKMAAEASILSQTVGVTDVHGNSRESLPFTETKVTYLLISPLLAPVTYALAPFHGELGALPHKTLAIFGTSDLFTSSSRLLAWGKSKNFEAVDIQDGDHFWRDPAHMRLLLQSMDDWLRRTQ